MPFKTVAVHEERLRLKWKIFEMVLIRLRRSKMLENIEEASDAARSHTFNFLTLLKSFRTASYERAVEIKGVICFLFLAV